MKALVVDDELHARELLKIYLTQECEGVEVVAMAADTQEARELIAEHKPDVVFLDIEMPDENGVEFLATYKDPPFYPVMVTSHAEYAIDAIKANAIEYLLKPLDPQDLVEAIAKISKRLNNGHKLAVTETTTKLALKNVSHITYVQKKDILAVRAAGSYSEVLTKDGEHVVSINLKNFETMLDERNFMRVHNSHIINLDEVVSFIHQGNYAVLSNGQKFIVSNSRKEEFKALMES